MKRDVIRKRIDKDCRKTMFSAMAAYSMGEVVEGAMAVLAASLVGTFADAVFKLDFDLGVGNLVKLLLAVIIGLVFPSLFNMFGEILMTKGALMHDKLLLMRFLDKRYADAMKIDEGEIASRLEDDAIDMRCQWVWVWSEAIVVPVTFIYLLYNVLNVSLIFAVIVFGVSLIKLIVPALAKKLRKEFDMKTREYNGKVKSYETDITKKPHVVKLLGLKEAFVERLDDIYKDYYKTTYNKSLTGLVLARNMSAFLNTFCTLIILLVGAVMVADGSITAGAVAAMVGYFAAFNTVVSGIETIIKNVPLYNNSAERIRYFYEDGESVDGKEVKKVETITADKLSFAYDDKTIFKNISFKIDRGMKVAVCGTNGSGKTTLIKLLCGLLKGYEGSLKLGDAELSGIAVNSWREQFAFAEQDAYLFAGSIKENVWFGKLEATEAEVAGVMDRTGITYLADRDVSVAQKELSGGEKQKISIARALLKNTPFLILDEPDNNLDVETLVWLKEFIKKCDRTVIFISHDADMLEVADARIAL